MVNAPRTESLESGAYWTNRRNILDLDDFSQSEITILLDSAESMLEVLHRDIKKVPSLRGKVIITLFYEPSTRTRVSFEQAGKLLSADVINMGMSGSSIEKGESLLNTALTLQASRTDLIVIRHPHSGAPYFLARNLGNTGIINAGDGRHAHPTQALLDLFTIRRRLGNMQGTKVVIVGDVVNSRVARSDIIGLMMAGANVVLSGPPTLLPYPNWYAPYSADIQNGQGSSITIEPDLDKAIDGADAVIALRIQRERQQQGLIPSLREYTRRWQITNERFRRTKSHAILMHPGPLNEGIEVASSLAHSAQSVIEEQVTNGLAVRMAALYLLLTGTNKEVPKA